MTTRVVEHFDHFVVPVDDIVAAEDFYQDVFAGRFALNRHGATMRMGLNVQHRMVGAVPHTFFMVAGKRIGVFLQDEPRPKPAGVHGAPTYSFAATAAGLERTARALKARNAACEGPADDSSALAARSLYFNDPAGNHFHLFQPRDAVAASTAATDPGLTGVGYLQLEAPALDESVRFYSGIFGLETAWRGTNKWLGAREVALRLPSAQLLSLTEVPFSPKGMPFSRHEAGPHLAFYVPGERWSELMARLSAHGIEHADRAVAIKDRQSQELDTYFADPSGYIIQLIGQADV